MNLPITSRIKRSPFLKDKDPKNEKATASSITKGGTTTKNVSTTTTSEDPNLTEFKDRCGKYGGKNSAAAAADGCKWADDAKDPEPVTTVTNKDVVVKGEDEIVSTDLYQDRKQKVLSNADVSNAQFATKRSTKNLNKAGNRLDRNTSKIEDLVAKYDKSTTDKDGKVVKADGKLSKEEYGSLSKGSFFGIFGNDRKKYDKLQRKKDKYSSRVDQFKSANKNQARSQESGRSWNDETKTTDRIRTKGEYSDPEQLKMKKDELAVKKAKAKQQGITGPSGGQASGAIEGVAVTAPVYNYSQENKSTPLGMTKKKSPAYKMKGSMFQKRY